MSPQADVRAVAIKMGTGGAVYDVVITSRADDRSRTIERLALPMHGAHNVQNSLAAIAVANEMGIDDDVIRRGLGAFGGVERRFNRTRAGHSVPVIVDYGHHPVEVGPPPRA